MHRIYLTSGIKITEPCFSGLDTSYRTEAWELLREYDYDLLKHNATQRLEFIAAGISRRNGSMLLGSAISNAEEATMLIALLHRENLNVHTVYIPSAARIDRQEARACRELDGFARWTDIYPRDIAENYRNYRETLDGLRALLQNSPVQLKEVD